MTFIPSSKSLTASRPNVTRSNTTTATAAAAAAATTTTTTTTPETDMGWVHPWVGISGLAASKVESIELLR